MKPINFQLEERSKRLLKAVVILIIIPLTLFFFIFEPLGSKKIEKLEDRDKWQVIDYEKPTARYFIRNIFETPFTIGWYKFCFRNKNITSKTTNRKNITFNEFIFFEYQLNSNSKRVEINQNERFCKLINIDIDKFSFRWGIEQQVFFDPSKGSFSIDTQFNPHIETYVSPDFWSVLVKLGLFLFSFWALLLLFREIYQVYIKNN
jgi:hypothetical protein